MGERVLIAKTSLDGHWPRGGVAVTAGGLIFSGTISDSTIRAYDKDTGKILWQKVMPAGPEGIPAVFEVKGREYLAFSARPSTVLAGSEGRRPARAPAANAGENTQGYYVFALPRK